MKIGTCLLMIATVIVLCVLVALFYNTVNDQFNRYFGHLPPGPLSLPLIGGVYTMDKYLPHISIMKLGKKYGRIFTIRLGTLGQGVILQDMKYIKQIFEDPECNDRPDMPVFDLLNNGADGLGSCPYSKKLKCMKSIFSQGTSTLIKNSIHRHANNAYSQFFDKIRREKLGQEYFIEDDIFNTCAAVFTSLVYGFEPESLDSKNVQMCRDDMMMLLGYLDPGHPINLCPLIYYLPLKSNKAVWQCVLRQELILEQSLVKHKDNFNGDIKDLIDTVVKYINEDLTVKQELADLNISLHDLLKSVWAFFLAGCSTIVDTVNWSMLYLAVRPDIQRRIQEEIDNMVQDPTRQGEDKSQLHYTRATIFEILRKSSTIPLGLPTVSKKDTKLGEFVIPKGTLFFANQWTIHHDEKYWDDPFTFKPERFLDTDGKLFPNHHIFHRMPFIPFSFGKRACPGQNIAIELMLDFIVAVFRQFTVSLPTGYKADLMGKVSLNLKPKPYPLIFTVRQ